MRSNRFRTLCRIEGLYLLALAATPAAADTTAPASRPTELPMLTVEATAASGSTAYAPPRSTAATRFEADTLEVPQSVQVIGRALIEDSGAVDVGDILKRVPSAYVGNTRLAPFTSFSWKIRGFDAAVTRNGYTILHHAARYGFYDVAKAALKAGVKPSVEAYGGFTPLHYAARENHLRITVLLVENGADTSARISYGWTPGDLAFSKSEPITNYLQSKGASFSKGTIINEFNLVNGWPFFSQQEIIAIPFTTSQLFRAIEADSADQLAELESHGVDLKQKSPAGTPPLCLAIANRKLQAADYLLKKAADLAATDANGKNALLYAIEYRNEDFVERVRELTDRRGVDLILDMVGGDYVGRNLRALAVEGRLVQIPFLEGAKIEADFTPLMIKRLHWTGSTLRPRNAEEKAHIARQLREHPWPLLESGAVVPVIHETFDLADASAAHELMESSRHIGKILLKVAGDGSA